jgi:hypothetical protein
MSKLELRWLGHACFALKYKDFTVVFDPFQDNYVRGFGSLDVAADLVLCSHFHNDHGAADVVRPLEGHENPFQVTGIQTFHDPEGGKLRGENVIHILEADGFKVAQKDMELRGPGELFGTRQSGALSAGIGALAGDTELLKLTHDEARALMQHPDSPDARTVVALARERFADRLDEVGVN